MSEKKNTVLSETEPLLRRRYGDHVCSHVMQRASVRYEALCKENADDPAPVKHHTEGTIFPAIALFEAMTAEGFSRKDAAEFLYDSFAERAEKPAAQMRALFKIPGLYRLYPSAFRMVTRRQFGTNAGFRFHFYDLGRNRARFDMLQCPYFDICRKYGCPEIVPAFCHTDDINNQNLHPRLHWNRTKTLGQGGDCCDFDVSIE